MTVQRVILAGGPLHGRRLTTQDAAEIVVPYLPPVPLFSVQRLSRPKWWRDPAGWLRWKPGVHLAAADPVPFVRHTYRRAGFLDDDTRVYWYYGPHAGEPPASDDEVMRHVWEVVQKFVRDHPEVRGARWEMGPAWWYAIQRAAACTTVPPGRGDVLVGYPVTVIDGTASPRITTEEAMGR